RHEPRLDLRRRRASADGRSPAVAPLRQRTAGLEEPGSRSLSVQLLPVDIDERLRAVASEQPNAPAVKDARRTLTWGEFDARISRVANALLARGVEPEDRVAILGRNSVAYLEVFFGCLRAGGCVVPLSSLSSDETLSGMLEDSGAR